MESNEPAPASRRALAEDLFLEGQDRGVGIEQLLEAHPELRQALLAVAEEWEWLDQHREGNVLPDDLNDVVRSAEPRYERVDELGTGGMGVVWRVTDTHLNRALALKISATRQRRGTPGHAPSRSRGVYRLLDEAQVMGQLDHPGVLPVHDVGLDEDGHAWFTMDLVDGDDLRAVIARLHAHDPRGEWNLARVIRALAQVAETMAFAHSKGVLHRDLKPHNIMVGKFGQVYVMDWGLARLAGGAAGADAFDAEATLETSLRRSADSGLELVTADGIVVGTPAYMAPEQAVPGAPLDERADVYAIGALLYHVLAGRAPYDDVRSTAGTRALLDAVRDGPPKVLRPNSEFAPSELVAIANRAMQREPEQRYPDMQSLRDDLVAWIDGRPVRAAAPGLVTYVRKWTLRNKLAATGLLATIAAVLLGTVLTARAEKRRSQDLARKNTELTQANDRANAQAYAALLGLAQVAAGRGLRLEAEAHLDAVPEEQRDWLWQIVGANLDESDLTITPAGGQPLQLMARQHSTGRFAVACGSDVVVVDPRLPNRRTIFQSTNNAVVALEFHPWLDRLVICDREGAVCVCEPGGQRIAEIMARPSLGQALAIDPDTDTLWVGPLGGHELCTVDLSAPVLRAVPVDLPRGWVRDIAKRPHTNEIWALRRDHALIIDTVTKEIAHKFGMDTLGESPRLAFSKAGDRVAFASGPGLVNVHEAKDMAYVRSFATDIDSVSGMEFSPDGVHIAMFGPGAAPVMEDVEHGGLSRRYSGHLGRVRGLAWETSGRAFWTCSLDGTIRRFEQRDQQAESLALGWKNIRTGLAWDPLRRVCWISGTHDRVIGFDPRSGAMTKPLPGPDGEFSRVLDLQLSSDGDRLHGFRTNPPRPEALTWDLDSRRLLLAKEVGTAAPTATCRMDADLRGRGPTSYVAIDGGTIAVCEGGGGEVVRSLRALHESRRSGLIKRSLLMITALPSGNLLVSLEEGRAAILDTQTDEVVRELQLPCSQITAGTVSPDGREVAVGAMTGEVLILDSSTFEVVARMEGLTTRVVGLTWMDGGERVLGAVRSGRLRLWDRATGRRLLDRQAGSSRIYAIDVAHEEGAIFVSGNLGLDVWAPPALGWHDEPVWIFD